MTFKDPWILLLIPFVTGALIWRRWAQGRASVVFPSLELLQGDGSTWKVRFRWIPFALRLTVIALFVVSLAGPRKILEETVFEAKGIDIILAVDTSMSMAAEDFHEGGKRINRLNISKRVVQDFIDGRPFDRIGLIAFAGLAYTVSPLTRDGQWLKANLERLGLGMIRDGTAIGSAISSGLARLKKSDAKSRVIILLTDGMNNSGKVDPLTAAQAAKAMGVKIYTIGAGSDGVAPFPVQDPWGRKLYQRVQTEIDEQTLKDIARLTGGQYFRATDAQALRGIYEKIDQMEKVVIQEKGYREFQELFPFFLIPALVLWLFDLLAAGLIFVRVP